ncbi:MAG: hypothetical protein K8R69_09265 [Deltaproteobacteria bacterium]|nr:hypothetical protein [Deltaproteobacteria bacterium]
MAFAQVAQLMRQECKSCGYSTTELIEVCPQCRRAFIASDAMRRSGYLQIALGAFLVLLMSGIGALLGKIMIFPAPGGSHFTGGPREILMIVGVFGLVISVGLAIMLNGYWQIRFGRRNKYLVYFIFAFLLAFVGFGYFLKMKAKLG